jgi:protein required for attachment to host cells
VITIVIANQGQAQIYETQRLGEKLESVASLKNASAHLTEHELATDASGRAMNRATGMHQTYGPGPVLRQTAIHRFAQAIADALNEKMNKRDGSRMVLVAEPRFLAEIKRACTRRVLGNIARELRKDLAHESTQRIIKRLRLLRASSMNS